MKKITKILSLIITFSLCSSFSFAKESKSLSSIFHIEIDTTIDVPDENVSIIYFILSNTYENSIHKMRGETDNKVYTNEETGQEVVYNKNGKLVTNSYNKGSFNFAKYSEPFKKFSLDILPWLTYGNAKNDPTSFGERLYAYLWDLDYGIQSYIFNQEPEKIKKVSYKNLSKSEKEITQLFNQIIFNEDYSIKLSNDNINKLRSDSDYYFRYLDQIFLFMGYEQ